MSSKLLRHRHDEQETQEIREPLHVILNDNPIRTIWRLNHLVHRYAYPFYNKISQKFGVSRVEYLTLHCLDALGVLRAQQLVYILARPKNTVSDAVNSLLRKGLIIKTIDPHDGRSAILSLTPDGKSLFRQILPILIDRQERVLEPLTNRERRSLDDILDKLIASAPKWWDEPI